MIDSRSTAIITGAASGLGRALAVRLARDGWQLALADLNQRGCEETLRMVESAGGSGHVERLDVASPEEWAELRRRLTLRWEHLDLLVNNAGVAGCGNLGDYPLEDWHWLLNINLYGAIYGCHALIDWLKANPRGAHVINTASFAAIAPSPSMAAYNVAKAGVVALSETLYSELKPHRVGVTVVCPMFFRTQIQHGARAHDPITDAMLVSSIEEATLTAEEVADAAIRGMRRGQLYVIPGRQGRLFWWLRRLMPTRFLDAIARDTARRRQQFERLPEVTRAKDCSAVSRFVAD
jgi:NAD(P)-dependent dehydrogenase (short-subunit alcohol dehydrogenase family)